MLDIKFKKRASLNEANFRRFENDIANACKGTIIIDPMKRIPPLKATSYSVQIRDAMKSFNTEHWGSTIITPCYEMNRIKVRITEDDKVALVNEYEDRMGTAKKNALPKTSIIVGPNGVIVKGFQKDPVLPEKTFIYQWPEEKEKAIGMCISTHEADSDWPGSATVHLIKCENESEWDAIKNLEKTYRTLTIEEVGVGCFRVLRWA